MYPNQENKDVITGIVDLLIERTKSGKVRWQPTDRGGFVTNIGANTATVDGVKGPHQLTASLASTAFPTITIRDPDGQTRLQAGGLAAALTSSFTELVDRDKLQTLADLISQQANEVDPILYEIMQKLEDL